MPVFEVYNPDGSLQFNLAGRVPRILGTVTITAAGSLVDAGLLTGTLFYTLNPAVGNYRVDGYPAVSLSGSTLTWAAPTGSLILTYGVY